ncbi:MAG: hypothetical protein PHD61_06380 [Bacteroidales bacterium]|nr:hypothetical protein [Lentimicrobiaceae bacterium]MDD5694915.1 hypothetical protein [Bacteroidales bacterium]
MKRNFRWWESLKHIAGFRDMRNGTYRMVDVKNPRTVQNHSRPTLNCESETELFPITCSAYKEAYQSSGRRCLSISPNRWQIPIPER